MPFEPIIDALRAQHTEQKKQLPKWIDVSRLQIIFMGVVDKRTKEFFKRLDVKVINIPAGKLRRYPSPLTIVDILFRLPLGVLLSLWHMWRIMPDAVISKGGYGSIPVVLTSTFYRVPVLLHESDAVAGLAVRFMGSLAAVITVGFAQTRHNIMFYKQKTVVTGTPVRSGFAMISKEEAKRELGMDNKMPILLVMGGSQGAEQINEVLLQILPSLIKDMKIIHIAGEKHVARVKEAAEQVLKNSPHKSNYAVHGFIKERIENVIAAADLILSRAGATALAEFARMGKAVIAIPLPAAAQDHQRRNVEEYEKASAIRVIDPVNLGKALLERNIRDLMKDRELRDTMSVNIVKLDHPKAAREIVTLAYRLAAGFVPIQPSGKSKT